MRLGPLLALLAASPMLAADRLVPAPDEAGAAVALVNGQAIAREEFVEAWARARAAAPQAGDAELGRLALEHCVREAVLEQLGRAHGLVATVGHAARREQFERENEQRVAAKARGEVVFGPVPLRWEQYLRLRRDRLELALRKIAAASSPPTEEEIERFYAENPAQFTAPGESAPRPYAELHRHVRAALLRDRYDRHLRRNIETAEVRIVAKDLRVEPASAHAARVEANESKP